MRKFRLVNAATGTGKTIAYLAPIIHHLQSYDKRIDRSDGTFGACCYCFELYLVSLCHFLFCFQTHLFV